MKPSCLGLEVPSRCWTRSQDDVSSFQQARIVSTKPEGLVNQLPFVFRCELVFDSRPILRTALKSASVRGPEETKRENCWCVRGGKGERYSWHAFKVSIVKWSQALECMHLRLNRSIKFASYLQAGKIQSFLPLNSGENKTAIQRPLILSRPCLCQVSRGILSIWDRRCYCLLDEGGLVSGEEMNSVRYVWYKSKLIKSSTWVDITLQILRAADWKVKFWKWSDLLKESCCLCWKISSFEEFALSEIDEKYARLKQWI